MKYPLFARNDLNAFWALFAENLANLLIISAVCRYVFQMPGEIVFGRILPGAAVAILLGMLVYVFLARRLACREQRSDVTALPYGISTPVMFVYLFRCDPRLQAALVLIRQSDPMGLRGPGRTLDRQIPLSAGAGAGSGAIDSGDFDAVFSHAKATNREWTRIYANQRHGMRRHKHWRSLAFIRGCLKPYRYPYLGTEEDSLTESAERTEKTRRERNKQRTINLDPAVEPRRTRGARRNSESTKNRGRAPKAIRDISSSVLREK